MEGVFVWEARGEGNVSQGMLSPREGERGNQLSPRKKKSKITDKKRSQSFGSPRRGERKKKKKEGEKMQLLF